ncbi:MAG: response regulator transcription factor [Sphaerochaeta sp.]|jgi:DNA-binding response OmpR family regulator|nr:response regulator transcription factor [Sphaerochaeta sp.]
MKLIYVVDDNAEDREGIKRYLEMYEFEVQAFEDLHALQVAIAKQVPDLLLQDVMLPDGDGFSFIKKLKQTYSFPVFFVTARTSESDRILGFELGCDDYICKPYSSKELELRVEALFRRIDRLSTTAMKGSQWTLDNSTMTLDETSHQFFIDGKPIPLTAAEWRIMSYLVANSGILITRSQILEHCFDYSFESYDRIVDTHVKNIRSKMGPLGSQWIETVRGYGYRFAGKGTGSAPLVAPRNGKPVKKTEDADHEG